MGFFSQNCHGCGHPLLRIDACIVINEWMNDAVVIDHDGTITSGPYDGYGRVGDTEYDDDAMKQVVGVRWGADGQPSGDGPTVWHAACWNVAGCPAQWQGESPSSDDQGWFFDDADHAMARPTSMSDLTALPTTTTTEGN
jgi:hypothetical protein